MGDHPGLRALDEVDLLGLVRHGEVAVQDPEAARRAIAMAMRASVTVSIAEDSSGRRTSMRLETREVVSTSLGMTSLWPGSSSTSSKVRPISAKGGGPGRAVAHGAMVGQPARPAGPAHRRPAVATEAPAQDPGVQVTQI